MAAEWLIFFLPLTSFALIVFVLRPYPRWCGYVTVAAIGGSLIVSIIALIKVMGTTEKALSIPQIAWLTVGNFSLSVGLMIDSLTAVMLIVVTGVSLMVQFYSLEFMHGDRGYSRYFAFMSLFTTSMLGLVMADNLLVLYVFWEMVGLCSYLLIGFWFERPSAAAAAKKAFIVTRLGDFGFLLAILLIFANTGTLSIRELFLSQNVELLSKAGLLGLPLLTWVLLGVFSGAAGKSAQFPLHVWLPDAMEGPTPVSALIHAATMVAAGVFLVARLFPLFEHSPQALTIVAVIGGFTAFFAATMGLVMFDYKRVLAYSTVSQLGYMMLGLGVGGLSAGIFHLMNHAFFKALLFLGAGSASHATGTYDIRGMGGLRRTMPISFFTFLIAALSISGIPPFSGFWSKDEVLTDALDSGQYLLFALGLAAAFMTAFYMFRLAFIVYGGSYRGAAPAHSSHGAHGAPRESPWVMILPLVLLAIPSIVSGLVNLNGDFTRFLEPEAHFAGLNYTIAGVSILVSALGIFSAYAIYGARWLSAETVTHALSPLHSLVFNKYWMDELYQKILDSILLGLCRITDVFDRYVVDGAVNRVAWVTMKTGQELRQVQSGQAQSYGVAIFFGVLVMLAVYLIVGVR
ncbi:MAG: NADH-quinone oxidoreductase subunit L [Chloroflexi bacterium]|nr:NADH-quinone oxidoreductase subunit L [Chloroflexota bacterium]